MVISDIHEYLRRQLCDLHDHLRELICRVRDSDKDRDLAGVACESEADTIYHIDKVSEEAIGAWFAENWLVSQPVEVVMEGLDSGAPFTFPKGTEVGDTLWKCILDPIDGTRNLMYDKRSAWVLTGIAPQKGDTTSLRDIVVAAMTELPPSRAWRSDQISAIRGTGASCKAFDVRNPSSAYFTLSPSTAIDCRHGFASVTRFFPDGLELLGRLEETLWKRLYPDAVGGSPRVFNDQYLTTGGQLHELLSGRDRFIADLRPLAFRKLGIEGSLSCHPYDLAAALVAEESGVILEDPLTGQPLAAPLDTTTPVAWVGYANRDLRDHIRPVLTELIHDLLVSGKSENSPA